MAREKRSRPQRVLIASTHALFAQGLRSLLESRRQKVEVIGVVSTIEEALQALESQTPDLIIVDYDDETLNRDEFLARFVGGGKKLRVVLLSLHDGQEALVYDRRTLAAAQIDDWLEGWNYETQEETPSIPTSLAGITRPYRRGTMKHLIIAGTLVVVVTALLLFGLQVAHLLPLEASLQAQPIDRMFKLEFTVIAFLFSLIVVFMAYSILVFRRRKGDTSDAPHITGNTRLEVLWTALPLATVLAFSFMGAQALADTQRVDPQAMVVNVIGSQWSWRFEYPEWQIVSTELRLPVNQQALLQLSSTDVIHSFWVPEFRVKQDALPGGKPFVRPLRVTPTVVGEYKVRCAELCGLQHAYMEAPVLVMNQSDFQAWVNSQSTLSANPVERGQKWYETFGCKACHSLDGTPGVGPSWKGIYGHQVTFTDGSTAQVDDAYIIESIRNPGAKIVAGYQNVMPPNIASGMNDAQIQDIIEFIKSLK